MPKYRVYGTVTGTKYLGEFEADSPEEALAKGLESDENYVSLCHQCADEFDLNEHSCQEGEAELVEADDAKPSAE